MALEQRIGEATSDHKSVQPYRYKLTGHTGQVNDVHFCHRDFHIVSASGDGTLRMWNAESGQSVACVMHDNKCPVTACSLNKAEDRLLSSSWDETLRLWDLEASTEVWKADHGNLLTGCAMGCSASEHLAVSSCNDHCAYLWDTAMDPSSKPVHVFKGHTNTVSSCQVSMDHSIVATTSMDATAAIWDLRMPGRMLLRFANHVNTVTSCALSRNGHLLVTAGYDRKALRYDIATGVFRKKGPEEIAFHEGVIGNCRFSPKEGYLVTCGYDNLFALWKTEDFSLHYKLKNGHQDWVMSADISTDEKWIATASKDCSVRVWSVENKPDETYRDPRKMLGLNIEQCARCGRDYSSLEMAEQGTAYKKQHGQHFGWCVVCRLHHPSRILVP